MLPARILLSLALGTALAAAARVIVWGGYELASPWLLDHPRRLSPGPGPACWP